MSTCRLASAVVTACLFLLIFYPWRVNYCDPEGNWFPGPLWLFKVQSFGDKLIGGLVTAALIPLIFAFILKPGRLTAAISIAGFLAWVGFGMWLASMASC